MTIDEALRLYKIPYDITERVTGGGFISFKLEPTAAGATINKLTTRLPDLIIATGENLELVNDNGLYIRYKTGAAYYDYFDYNGYIDYNDAAIPFIVGFNNDQIRLDTIEAARHLLIAGTTGSGKSVFLHNLIYTFICNPNNYLYLVDCKRVEFNAYRNNATVASEVFGDISAATIANTFIIKMEARYQKMQDAGVNDFKDYKKLYPDKRRYILVIDELSDLISTREARAAIIPQLLRIAQKGRAAGFHLILATQRPDATIINGTLKGNIPTRIAFKTISTIDSHIILDRTGAERLAGNGDALYLRNGGLALERVQTPYISINAIKTA